MFERESVDAVLSANIYCNRKLDPLLRNAIAPFWRSVRERHGDEVCFLWLFRYGKCGEHAKLRFYGSDGLKATVLSTLPLFLDRFFSDPISDPLPGKWVSKSGIPAVDLEDELDGDYPNKTLLWTHYRRSPVLIGSHIYTLDDKHVDFYNRSQAAATEVVLDCVVGELDREDYRNHQQAQFLKILIAGISALDFDVPKWIDYLTYHRDWLIRSFVERPTSLTTRESMLVEFDQRMAKMPSGVEGLSLHVLRGSQEGFSAEGYYSKWARAVTDLYGYVKSYRGKSEYDQDPYTRDFAYLPLFKTLHGAGNQFGFRLSHEAYLYHVLLCAAQKALQKISPHQSNEQEFRRLAVTC